MKKKLTPVLILAAILVIIAAVWQAKEAATLEDKLLEIDRQTQTERLLALALPEVQAKLNTLLQEECDKMGRHLPFNTPKLPMPAGGKADFNRGFFLHAENQLLVPEGDEALLNSVPPVIWQNVPHQARYPHSSILDPDNLKQEVQGVTTMKVSIAEPTRPEGEPLRATGDPEPFFGWTYKGHLVYMRPIRTNGGRAADGFLIDTTKLAEHLIPVLQKNGLQAPQIELTADGNPGNLGDLPLVVKPGKEVDLPNVEERSEALRGTIASAWMISILTVIVLFGLLAFYARVERRRSDFVSAVTHELRTPLTSFTLYTEMLKNGDLPQDKVQEYHDTLYNESRRLGHLVENVLAFAKLTRGKVRGRQDVGACGKLLPELFDKIKERLKKDGVELQYTLDSRLRLLSLRTDLLSVEQILINLADNAVKYAENKKPCVHLNVLQTHRMLNIRFTDNGPGIAPQVQKDLFRPFSRSAKAESGRKPGVGLGLALSRDLAHSIGGDLTLERSDEKGTTFVLSLPLGE
ncbi:MAG: HAMP domain-containing histidine kinase [Akkermansia sp.]|nr:HAMP domain-containing histidine kinase [Akkermansia sp.]